MANASGKKPQSLSKIMRNMKFSFLSNFCRAGYPANIRLDEDVLKTSSV